MKKMYKTLMFALTLIGSTLWAQQPENGAQIRIQKNENGKETVIIRKMEKDNIAELEKMIDAEEILRTLGVPGENEEIEVIIRKKTIDADGSAQAPETGRVIPNCKMDVAPKKAFLGVYFNPEGGETGTEVTSIVENSPAQKAGLEKGDIIVKVESEKASAGKDLRDIISEFDAGQKVKIEILRKGEKKKIQVVLGEKEIREERKIIIREPKTKLGVILDPVMDESGEMIILDVLPGSLAEKLGLQKGDQLINMNKMHIDSRSDITMALLEGKEGQDFVVEFLRSGKLQTASTKFGETQLDFPEIGKIKEEMLRNLEVETEGLNESILSKDAIVYRFRKISGNETDKTILPGETGKEIHLDVSPNPSSGQIKVDFFVPDAKELTLTVRDLNGKEVLKRVFEGKNISQSVSLNLENESKGAYFISLDWDGGKLVKKIVVKN